MTTSRDRAPGVNEPRPLAGFLRKQGSPSTSPSTPLPHAEEAREAARLDAVGRYDILDTPREEAFDRITRLTRRIFDVPMAAVTVIDGHRQWLKAFEGPLDQEGPREDSFCRHSLQSPEALVVPDALADPRFQENPAVTGAPHVRAYAGIPLINREGHTIGTLCAIDTKPRTFDAHQLEILADLARIALGELELRRRAARDSLTGVYSRLAFREHGERAVALALRHHQALSLVVVDVDHFKAINDTLGHAAGDDVLKKLVEACGDGIRKTDLIGRLGGEEFGIILPGADTAAALEVAEKLRAAVHAADYGLDPANPRKVSASFGIASLDRSARDLDTLLANADAALYKAKASGRNICIAWQAMEPLDAAPPRRRVLKSGMIIFNGRTSALDCTVRSLSDEGAGIEVYSSRGLPRQFTLAIRADKFERPCRVVTMTEKSIEVVFETEGQPKAD